MVELRRSSTSAAAAAAAGLLLVLAAWLLATPIGAGVDESSQVVAAVADAHLETRRSPEPGAQEAYQRVAVARTFALLHEETLCVVSTGGPAGCRLPPRLCRGLAGPAARCQLPAISDPRPSSGLTWTGRYPPAYLFVVGLPSLASSAAGVVLAMRAVSAALSLGCLGLAVLAALRSGRRPLLVLGVLAAATPTLLGTAAIVNPSGLEISSALALWSSGTALVLDDRPAPSWLLAAVGTSSSVLALARPASPIWLAVILGVLGIVAGRQRLRQLASQRPARRWAAVVLAATAVATTWIVLARSTLIIHEWLPHSLPHAVAWSLRSLPSFALEAIAQLGVGKVAFPAALVWAWGAVAALPILVGGACALRSRSRRLVGALALVIACAAAPIALSAAQVPEATPYGRYLLVLLVGLPVLFGGLGGGAGAKTARAGLVLLGILQVAALSAFVHRMAVGPDGPWFGGSAVPGGWSPPVPVPLVIGLAAIGSAVSTVALWPRGLDRRSPAAPIGSGGRDEQAAAPGRPRGQEARGWWG